MDKRSASDGFRTTGGTASLETPRTTVSASDLARLPDFRMGLATVRPSLRTVDGPQASVVVEPRVMQVLVALSGAEGAVLSRDELMRSCWSGMVVGEDAITRTIAEIRRIARSSGAGFGIETIPRVGYRIVTQAPSVDEHLPASPGTNSRRWWLVAGMATLTVGSLVTWRTLAARDARRYAELVAQARQALRINKPTDSERALGYLEEATAVYPQGAEAWGLLALTQYYIADSAPRERKGTAMQACEQAVRRALAIDAREPNAQVAGILLGRRLDSLFNTEQRLRRVLESAPRNAAALDHLVAQLQAAGYHRESLEWNERALSFDALRPIPLARRAMKLWISGDSGAADMAAAGALDLYPSHPVVWNFRLLIFAFTGRWQAARLLIDELGQDSTLLAQEAREAWRTWLDALESRAPPAIQRAREVGLAVARASPGAAVHAILSLSALGEVDAAYEIIDGLLLRRGNIVTRPTDSGAATFANDRGWKDTQWLFTPSTAPLRVDRRFSALCDTIGLSRYWQQRGREPDERNPAALGSI